MTTRTVDYIKETAGGQYFTETRTVQVNEKTTGGGNLTQTQEKSGDNVLTLNLRSDSANSDNIIRCLDGTGSDIYSLNSERSLQTRRMEIKPTNTDNSCLIIKSPDNFGSHDFILCENHNSHPKAKINQNGCAYFADLVVDSQTIETHDSGLIYCSPANDCVGILTPGAPNSAKLWIYNPDADSGDATLILNSKSTESSLTSNRANFSIFQPHNAGYDIIGCYTVNADSTVTSKLQLKANGDLNVYGASSDNIATLTASGDRGSSDYTATHTAPHAQNLNDNWDDHLGRIVEFTGNCRTVVGGVMKTAWKDAEYINAMSEINFTSGERSKKVAGVLISDDAQQNTTSTTHTHNYGHLSMTFGVPNTHSQAEFAAAGDAMLWVVSEVDASTAVTTAEVLAVCDRWICTSELNTNFFANGASLPSDGDLLKNLTITDRKATTQTYFKNATGTGTFELAESSNGKALMNMTGDTIIYRNGSTLNISTELYFVSLFIKTKNASPSDYTNTILELENGASTGNIDIKFYRNDNIIRNKNFNTYHKLKYNSEYVVTVIVNSGDDSHTVRIIDSDFNITEHVIKDNSNFTSDSTIADIIIGSNSSGSTTSCADCFIGDIIISKSIASADYTLCEKYLAQQFMGVGFAPYKDNVIEVCDFAESSTESGYARRSASTTKQNFTIGKFLTSWNWSSFAGDTDFTKKTFTSSGKTWRAVLLPIALMCS